VRSTALWPWSKDTWRHAAGRTPPATARQEHRLPPPRARLDEGAPTVVTANMCLPFGVDNGTSVRVARMLFSGIATFTPIEVTMAGGRITIQLATCVWRCIGLQVRDGQGPSPLFLGVTDGQFPHMAPQTQRVPLPC